MSHNLVGNTGFKHTCEGCHKAMTSDHMVCFVCGGHFADECWEEHENTDRTPNPERVAEYKRIQWIA